jgi:hypothetical protein
MKNIKFIDLIFISDTTKSARKISFGGKNALLVGETSTGKSAILKSLFTVWGASPVKRDPFFEEEVFTILKFTIGSEEYHVLKSKLGYSFFNKKMKHMQSFDSVLSLADFLSDFLNMKMKLMDIDSEKMEFLTPSQTLMPFYIDQDTGWTHYGKSFKVDRPLKQWNKEIIKFFLGLTNNTIHIIQAKKTELEISMSYANSEIKTLKSFVSQLDELQKPADFSLDINVFTSEVEELVKESNALLAQEKEFKDVLWKYYSEKEGLEQEIRLLEKLNTRMDESTDRIIIKEKIDCPCMWLSCQRSF